MFFRCPDTNKPLGLMLLNGLTKLINEYKEVMCQTETFNQYFHLIKFYIQYILNNLSSQDPKLLCVAYSAVGKLSRYYEKNYISFFSVVSNSAMKHILFFLFVCFSRMPQLFTKDIALVQQFFESMCKVGERSLKNLTLKAVKA